MIPGVKVSMGGKDWEVPPLSLGQLRRLLPKVNELTGIGANMTEEQIGIVCEIIATAMTRNYSDMTIECVEELLDLGNAADVVRIVMTGSGLKLGEAKAVAGTNGATYTDISPPPVDTPIQ